MKTSDYMENLLYLFMLLHPATTADKIYNYWEKDKVLQEYPKPEKEELQQIVGGIKAEISMLII